MAEMRALQPSFTSGVLSPSLWARVDLAKYTSGLKQARNVFVHAHGGISNRPGLEFCGEVKDSADTCWLIPFQFSEEQSYQLEMGDGVMRVWRDGGVILSGGSPYEVVTPYAADDVPHLVFVQEADVMYVCHEDYPVQKISRFAEDNWTVTPVTFQPSIDPPDNLGGTAIYSLEADGAQATGTYVVTAVGAGGEESARSSGVSTLTRELGDGRINRMEWTASAGAVMYRIYRIDDHQGLISETPNTEIELDVTSWVGSGSGAPTSSDPGAPPVPTGVTNEVLFGDEISYVVSAISDDTGEESLPSDSVTVRNAMEYQNNKTVLTWDAVAGASAYVIYKEDNGTYGYIGRSEGTTFTDENITADISDGPQSGRNPFDAAGKYPRCTTFIEQRLAFASTIEDPQAVWLSQSANYENFGASSPAKASDAVTFRIKSRQVNEIRSLISVRGLMALSSSAEWVISGGSQSDAISPSAIKIDNQGYRGSSLVQPIAVGNTVIFAQARGGVVRDFGYEFTSDAYNGRDLTVMARHLFRGREIVSWAYAQAPHSIVWAVLDDGSLVSLTYMKEHDVWGWTQHDSAGGVFECVSVIPEDGEDVPYFIVRREIDGETVRYIERLRSREFSSIEDAFFVDSGLTYSGAPATEISGLDHLEGEELIALSDGNVVRGLVVEGGSVTLPNAGSKVHIGLPYTATIETLRLDLGTIRGLGTVQGRQKSISEVVLRVEDTRGVFIGVRDGERGDDHLTEYKQRATEAWNEAIQMYTGDIRDTPAWDWDDQGVVVVKQFDPLPMTILAIMPDITVGR